MLERELQDAAAELLRSYGFLVFHQRPARTSDGGFVSAVQYDGAGLPDLIAARPGCAIVFVEVKTDSAVSKDQKDWIRALGDGEGRYCAVLRPSGFPTFAKHVALVAKDNPSPPDWAEQLKARDWRHQMKKGKERLVTTIRETGAMPATTSVKMLKGHPSVFKVASKVYLYKGHGTDGSVCGYGPVIWKGDRSKWLPDQRAKFRCWPTGTKIVTGWKGIPGDG